MILVTGGAGFLGSHIVRRLCSMGQPVRVLVRDLGRAQREARLEGEEVDWALGDITHPESLRSAMESVDQVVHAAAIAIEKGNASYEEINYQGTVNVVDASVLAGVQRFLNISQMGADENLPYRFLASKGRAQAYVAGSNLAWTALRPSVLFGPQDEFANTFARLVPLSPFIFPIVGTQYSRFQPIWVGDVANCAAQCLADETTVHSEFELGGPEVLTLEEIERRTLAAVGARRLMVPFPLPLLRLIVTLMESLFPNPPVTRSLLELLQVSNVPDDNALPRFVNEPRAFTPETIRAYMKGFTVRGTVSGFLQR